MSGLNAYFVGGPLDLTKRYLQGVQDRLYYVGVVPFSITDLMGKDHHSAVDEILSTRHVYEAGPQLRTGEQAGVVIYAYAGLEERSRVDFKWQRRT